MTIQLTLTDAQAQTVANLDVKKPIDQIVQIHVNAWLAPLIQVADADDRDVVAKAYGSADPGVRKSVRDALGILRINLG